jgi:HlyD family type I secretion membrane fusion protein
MAASVPRASSNPYPYIVLGCVTTFFVFGGLGTWATLARLDSAIVAQGAVSAESNRKTIQHFEGGIVEEILVSESQFVNVGDVLVRLRPVQAEASQETQRNALDAALALEARLTAEQNGASVITFPESLTQLATEPTALLSISGRDSATLPVALTQRLSSRQLIDDQIYQFEERRASIITQTDIWHSRIVQAQRQIAGLEAMHAATQSQLSSLSAEYAKLNKLAEVKYFPLNRLMELQRRVVEQQGRLGQIEADIARNSEIIGESKLQIIQIQQKFKEDVAQNLREVRLQVSEYREKLRVAADVYSRVEVRAPRSGMVQALRVHTTGAVLRPGDIIMELVPLDDILVVHARVSPLDINYVRAGLEAEVRFPGVKDRATPIVLGKVRSVSADITRDDQSKEPYYLSIIEVKQSDLPFAMQGKLTAGMPTEVLIAIGERTVAQYLISPLYDAVRKSMREK